MTKVFAIGSAFCILYYLTILIFMGWNISFSEVWLLLGVLLGILSLLARPILGWPGIAGLPLAVKVSGLTIMITVCFVFLMVEIFIGAQMFSETDEELDYVVVLGAHVNGKTVSKVLKSRLDKAIEYLEEHEETIVIVSGGQGVGEEISEAEAMKLYLMDKGIDRTRIRQEVKSTNTAENLQFSKVFIKNGGSVGIISSDFHIFRATALANKVGFEEVIGIAAPSNVFLKLHYMIREGFAVLKDKFMGNI